MNQATAKLNHLRMAPRKVRLVADLIRGMSAAEAEAQLMMMRKRAALPVLKLLRSVVANAGVKNMEKTKLVVSSIRVDQGVTMKRSLPRAKGMATPIHKKSSHVTIVLLESAAPLKARFSVARREKKAEKAAARPKVAGAKGRVMTQDKKKAENPGFIRRVFRRKIGE
jgi:large subunit ribosomal protein L22